MTMQQITRGIFYEDSYLGVTLGALIFSHGIIMVDAPLRAEDARSWRSALINQRGGPNRLLVNLDAHPDRTLGTRALDCTIVAHQKTSQVFRNRSTIFKGQSLESGAVWETYNDAIGTRWALPDITFTERMFLHWGGPEVMLEHHPGPTPGSIWTIIPDARIIFVGDTLVRGQPPFLAYAELENWLASLDLLQSRYQGFSIVCGRGGLAQEEDIKILSTALQEVLKEMDKLAAQDASPDATEALLLELIPRFVFVKEWREVHVQRLRHGLLQCYARRYRAAGLIEQVESDVEEP